ncbi:hypothetical protein PVK06_033118 [Gossypium arboreum]|uniref:Senescence regulator S40 n=1 Tax=Gossypium arboreum TaxID=29729 RepID=A0ABR0NAI9_GOSAR|nr:hypothetical protein PVK06_033118 [Gossypium arboreum]
MAKGRRLTTSRSERFLGSYSYGRSHGDALTGESELGEEDVWSMVDNVTDRDDRREWSPRSESESNETANFDVRSGRRRIPRGDAGHVGGLSLAFDDSSSAKPRIVHQYRGHDNVSAVTEDSPRGRNMATSAPLNVPDWSKIYRSDSVEESMHDSDDDDDGESDMMPPHEYLARKKSGGASVFEGVGRTLKGRDMRRVRDAVWNQTGFYG